MIPTKTRFFAEGMSNRGGYNPYNRRRKRERCPHLHRSWEAANRCAKVMRKKETRPWYWRVQSVILFLFNKPLKGVRYEAVLKSKGG